MPTKKPEGEKKGKRGKTKNKNQKQTKKPQTKIKTNKKLPNQNKNKKTEQTCKQKPQTYDNVPPTAYLPILYFHSIPVATAIGDTEHPSYFFHYYELTEK